MKFKRTSQLTYLSFTRQLCFMGSHFLAKRKGKDFRNAKQQSEIVLFGKSC